MLAHFVIIGSSCWSKLWTQLISIGLLILITIYFNIYHFYYSKQLVGVLLWKENFLIEDAKYLS